jgi:hypothetical protein
VRFREHGRPCIGFMLMVRVVSTHGFKFVSDIDGSGQAGTGDLLALLGAWHERCSASQFAAILHLQRIVKPIEHVDVADEEREFHNLRVGEVLMQRIELGI